MALTQAERISISKKIVSIPKENANADSTKAQLEIEKAKIQLEDDGNRKLMDDLTPLINAYQQEFTLLDGNVRLELTEQNMIDSADKIFQNYFNPNDPQTALPNVPDGIWKNFTPFSGSIAIGKQYTEIYSTTTKEQDVIDAINAIITAIDAGNTLTNKTTGQECIAGVPVGFCTPTATPDTEAQCSIEGGAWTPASPDVIQNKADLQTAVTNLKTEIQNWETHLNNEKTKIQTADAIDTDSARGTANATAISDIDNAIVIIDTWQALTDFYTAHGATDCATFDALDPGTFPATKLATTDFQALKDELAARTSFVSTRSSELVSDTYLGAINQDFAGSGSIVAATGLFGKRFRIIDMRLNLMAGSLNKLKGLEKGQAAQEELKGSNDSAAIALTSVMSASAFRAPASNTKTIHVLDGSLFAASDSVYVVANTQAEIAATIVSVSTNTVVLDVSIPKKYRQNDGARLYKIL